MFFIFFFNCNSVTKECDGVTFCWSAKSRYSLCLHAYMNGNVLWLLYKCNIWNMLGKWVTNYVFRRKKSKTWRCDIQNLSKWCYSKPKSQGACPKRYLIMVSGILIGVWRNKLEYKREKSWKYHVTPSRTV